MASSFWRRVAVYFGVAEDPEQVEHDREAAELSTREIAVSALKFGVLTAVLWALLEWATQGHHLVKSAIGGAAFACAVGAATFFATRASRDRGRARAEHERRQRD